ncbi:hypothetical protein [Seleniivibrio woodruffii]|uniref:hypothetical protein n=1 Tax=Seleniivibrio woodruffii TaxID=1078050 RepID=UPI00240A9838|nr:hypothetical protein [Seleniivibrio woodruffii]
MKYIDFPQNVTSYYVNHILVKELHDTLLTGESDFTFNLSETVYFSALTLPNLLNIGFISKINLKNKIILITPQNTKTTQFLFNHNFFDICNQYDLFDYDERFVGGFSTQDETSISQTVFVPMTGFADKNESFEYILRHLKKSFTIYNRISNASEFIVILSELCCNSLFHGNSHCIITSSKANTKFPTMNIAISDTGFGFLRSIMRHKSHNFFSTQELSSNDCFTNLRAIFEAVFYRYTSEKYGLYSVLRDVIQKNGAFRIHFNDTQIIFNNSNCAQLKNFQSKLENSFIRDYFHYLTKEYTPNNRLESQLRITDYKLAGVHIEMEIPWYEA